MIPLNYGEILRLSYIPFVFQTWPLPNLIVVLNPNGRKCFQVCIDIEYVELVQDEKARLLSQLYLEVGGLLPQSKEDAMHIAIASVNDCDIILSWNFKHIVNLRAMTAVEDVNIRKRYKNIRILSPAMLLNEEE
jgi:hypothetical protein